MNLLKNAQISSILKIQSSGPVHASTFLNMTGWDGCLFLVNKSSDNKSTGPGSVQIQQSTGTSTSGAWISTAVGTISFTSDQNEIVAVDAYRPLRQYLRCRVTGLTDKWLGPIMAIQYKGRRLGSTEALGNVNASTVIVLSS